MVMYGNAMRKKLTNWSLETGDVNFVILELFVVPPPPSPSPLKEAEEKDEVLVSASDCALVMTLFGRGDDR
tara:strand:- start:1386 stop:1598 length:213 start_codon:yes stop_codon:yes gene_type:complete